MNKKLLMIATTSSLAIFMNGCASTGGLTSSENGECNTAMSTAAGALLGAAIGASIKDSRYAATGAIIGGAVFAAGCVMINANTVQKQSANDVENGYKRSNQGSLPDRTQIQQYTTVVLPSQTVPVQQNIVVKSDLTVVGGRLESLQLVQEKLALRDANGKLLKEIVKDIRTTSNQSFGSGNFENSFAWKFPNGVSKGKYWIDTEVLVNGKRMAKNSKMITLI